MTVIIYTGQSATGQTWPPDFSHEAASIEQIIAELWRRFHHLPEVYAIGVSLRGTPADMIIATERGIGIIELKDTSGRISIASNGEWLYDGKVIRAGKNYLNPYKQVQAYGHRIHPDIRLLILPNHQVLADPKASLPKIQLAVCFTNRNVDLEPIRKDLSIHVPDEKKAWEGIFSLLTPTDIPGWIASLRFELNRGTAILSEPPKITANAVTMLMTRLDLAEWKEIVSRMPKDEPYAYLKLIESGKVIQTFGLIENTCLIGRDPDKCQIIIPNRYQGRASREHARIQRYPDAIEIEDISSRGTWVNGSILKRERPAKLKHNDRIWLGGDATDGKKCELRFELRSMISDTVEKTVTDSNSNL